MNILLRTGSSGRDVAVLQEGLNREGADPPLVVDAVFGRKTAAALRTFQQAHGLTPDAIAGPRTWSALAHGVLEPGLPQGWIFGVDVSEHQVQIDGPALARAGAAFAVLRACVGFHRDALVGTFAEEITRGDLALGFYGALLPSGTAQAQASLFLNVTRPLPAASLSPWLDLEVNDPGGPVVTLTRALTWCTEVEQAIGRQALVYTGPWFFDELRKASPAAEKLAAELATRPLVVAHYTTKAPRVPLPWSDWALHQKSGDPMPGVPARFLPGTARPVDVDVFRGTRAELERLGLGIR